MRKRISVLLALAIAGSALPVMTGCRGDVGEDPPVLPMRNMYDQERYNPQSKSPFFADHRTMRTPVDGTQSREYYEDNAEIATGMREDGSGYVPIIPDVAIQRVSGGMEEMVKRGQARFGIYCVPCHSKLGDGLGTVAVRGGFPKIPNFTEERLRTMPDGQVFATITHGKGNMPSYAAQIPVADRWAIVSYLRALQLSQVSLAAPPPPQEKK